MEQIKKTIDDQFTKLTNTLRTSNFSDAAIISFDSTLGEMTKSLEELKKLCEYADKKHNHIKEKIAEKSISNIIAKYKLENNLKLSKRQSKQSGKPGGDENSREIMIAANIALDAFAVQSLPEKMESGVLYYIEPANHFALKIAGEMIHGNIGVVYRNEKNPVKIKNCKFGKDCTKNVCEYYHDPLQFGGQDRRNFIMPSLGLVLNSKMASYGNIETLDLDIKTIKKDELERFGDQLMHNLLCYLVFKKYSPQS